ncbi:hypothetical protein ABPG75_001202 [Micractinium tetrahymenae]
MGPRPRGRPSASPAKLLRRLAAPALLLLLLFIWARRPLHGQHADEEGVEQLPAGGAGSGGGRRSTAQLSHGASSGADMVAAVTSGAGVHGFVKKEGPADPKNWHPDHKSFRQARLEEWLAQRERLLSEGQLPPPLPIYTGCQVYVNHLYKVLFLRHAKTASSSLFCHFGGCRSTTGNETEEEAAARKALSFELFQAKTVGELEQLWQEYFVVSFVRNPYQRAVSSYRMMMRQLRLGGPGAEAYSWNRFCADPTGFADECMADEQCKKKGRNFVYVHIQPQHECIVTESGGWAVDFIGRVEHIDEDLGLVLAELEKRRPPEAPAVKPLEGSLANVNGRGCNESAAETGHSVAKEQYCDPTDYYRGEHAACFPQVQHHYHGDAHGLGFPGSGRGDTAMARQQRRRQRR